MEVVVLIAFAITGLGFFLWNSVTRGAAEGDALDAAKAASLNSVEGFKPEIVYEGQRTSYGLAIDPTARKFAISIPGAKPRVYHYTQLVAAEVERDGTTVTTTKGKISTGGAALATLIAGPVGGLLAGAKTSSTSTTDETVTLTLKLYVDDIHTPCFCIPFGSGFKDEFGPDKLLKNAIEAVDAWFGRFKTILVGLEGQRPSGTNPDAITYTAPAPTPVAIGWAARTFSA